MERFLHLMTFRRGSCRRSGRWVASTAWLWTRATAPSCSERPESRSATRSQSPNLPCSLKTTTAPCVTTDDTHYNAQRHVHTYMYHNVQRYASHIAQYMTTQHIVTCDESDDARNDIRATLHVRTWHSIFPTTRATIVI